ncbi:hypothetical protein ACSQ67_011527 [Phaseolus vulgaris]
MLERAWTVRAQTSQPVPRVCAPMAVWITQPQSTSHRKKTAIYIKPKREKLKKVVCAKRFRLFDRSILAERDRNCHKIYGGRRNMNGGGEHVAAESAVPVAAEKVVRSVKEIVDCTEHEIYAVLEECDMDVNRAVEKLLSQDTFHEVKSKRERKKEGAFNSRARGKNVGLSRGGKTSSSSDCSVVQSGLTHVTYNGIFSDCGTSCNFWYTQLVY